MTVRTPPARAQALHSQAGSVLATSEATSLAAGDSVVVQNQGNTIIHFHVTTAGTGTILALNSANNQAITLALGDVLVGPLDPSIFGTSVTITTASAVGNVGLYQIGTRYPNGLRNPFELNAAAPDGN